MTRGVKSAFQVTATDAPYEITKSKRTAVPGKNSTSAARVDNRGLRLVIVRTFNESSNTLPLLAIPSTRRRTGSPAIERTACRSEHSKARRHEKAKLKSRLPTQCPAQQRAAPCSWQTVCR